MTRFDRLPGGLGLLCILAAQAILVLTYSRLTPVGEGPDELSHLAYSRHLLQTGRLPIAGDRDESLTQSEHPPLYYAAGALLAAGGDLERLAPPVNPFFTANLLATRPVPNIHLHPPDAAAPAPGSSTARRMRLLSLACAMLVVAATWRIADLLLPGQQSVALAAAALIAFWPAFAFAGAVYSNDMGANAAAACVLAGAARLVAPRGRGRFTLPLAATALGLALLSKLTTLAMAPILGAAWWLERRRGAARGGWAQDLAALAIPLLLVFAWWPLRNMALYGLDQPLAWKRFAVLAQPMLRTVPLRDELPTYLSLQFQTLLGRFGWVSVPQPPLVYRAAGLALLAIVGCGLLSAVRRVRPEAGADPLLPAGRRTVALLLIAFAPVYASILQLGTRLNLVAAHARYFFSGLPLLALLVTICWALCWPPRRRAMAVTALPVAVLAWSVWAANAVIGPAFRRPSPAAASASVMARFAPGIVLHDARWASNHVRRGESARLSLLLSSTEDLSGRPAAEAPGLILFAQLIGPADRKAGQADGPPFEGRFPFEAWPVGSAFMVDIAVPVAADAPEGPVDLLVGIYPDGAPGDRLAAVDDVGSALSQNALRLPAALTVLSGAGAGQEGRPR